MHQRRRLIVGTRPANACERLPRVIVSTAAAWPASDDLLPVPRAAIGPIVISSINQARLRPEPPTCACGDPKARAAPADAPCAHGYNGRHAKVAVKVIDPRGDEGLPVLTGGRALA